MPSSGCWKKRIFRLLEAQARKFRGVVSLCFFLEKKRENKSWHLPVAEFKIFTNEGCKKMAVLFLAGQPLQLFFLGKKREGTGGEGERETGRGERKAKDAPKNRRRKKNKRDRGSRGKKRCEIEEEKTESD